MPFTLYIHRREARGTYGQILPGAGHSVYVFGRIRVYLYDGDPEPVVYDDRAMRPYPDEDVERVNRDLWFNGGIDR